MKNMGVSYMMDVIDDYCEQKNAEMKANKIWENLKTVQTNGSATLCYIM